MNIVTMDAYVMQELAFLRMRVAELENLQVNNQDQDVKLFNRMVRTSQEQEQVEFTPGNFNLLLRKFAIQGLELQSEVNRLTTQREALFNQSVQKDQVINSQGNQLIESSQRIAKLEEDLSHINQFCVDQTREFQAEKAKLDQLRRDVEYEMRRLQDRIGTFRTHARKLYNWIRSSQKWEYEYEESEAKFSENRKRSRRGKRNGTTIKYAQCEYEYYSEGQALIEEFRDACKSDIKFGF